MLVETSVDLQFRRVLCAIGVTLATTMVSRVPPKTSRSRSRQGATNRALKPGLTEILVKQPVGETRRK